MVLVRISVVIPMLDAAATIGAQLDAVLAQRCEGDFEVVVADNGSTDGSVEEVRRRSGSETPVVLVDASRRPRGGAAAKNLGVRAARSEFVAFCDADDLVRPGWLEAMATGLEHAEAVVVTREYWSLNPQVWRGAQPERQLAFDVCGCPGIAGGAFGIHHRRYLDLGGFNETMQGAVDAEFALRLALAGLTPLEVPRLRSAFAYLHLPGRPLLATEHCAPPWHRFANASAWRR
jgi:glycosyltransferase involved in cell wall biosynthesis